MNKRNENKETLLDYITWHLDVSKTGRYLLGSYDLENNQYYCIYDKNYDNIIINHVKKDTVIFIWNYEYKNK